MSRERRKLQEWADRRTKVFGMGFDMEVGPTRNAIEADRFPIQFTLSDGTDSRDIPHVELLNEQQVWDLRDHLLELVMALPEADDEGPQYTMKESERDCKQYEECYRTDPHGHLGDGGLRVRV